MFVLKKLFVMSNRSDPMPLGTWLIDNMCNKALFRPNNQILIKMTIICKWLQVCVAFDLEHLYTGLYDLYIHVKTPNEWKTSCYFRLVAISWNKIGVNSNGMKGIRSSTQLTEKSWNNYNQCQLLLGLMHINDS